MNNYDLIGDIHGYANELRSLLKVLGYEERNGCYRHDDRKVIFLGDFIDRGPKIRETLQIVRAMVDSGSALAVMGNHEYNALCYHTKDANGDFLRRHNPKNKDLHQVTLDTFENKPDEWQEWLAWFYQLPLYLEMPGLRVVHACWDETHLPMLNNGNRLTTDILFRSAQEGTAEFLAIETLLKGKELPLPAGYFFTDKERIKLPRIRVRWWLNGAGKTYHELALPYSKTVPHLPIPDAAAKSLDGYPHDAPPVFVGHYWLPPPVPFLVGTNVACLDFSVAFGGPLVAYRWDGEQTLAEEKFVVSHPTSNT